jgi:hypothetical protein
MTEIQYNFETPANIPLLITQGATFRKRWRFRYGTTLLPFPFYSDADPGVLLWKGRCMFRTAYADAVPKVSLLSSSEPPGVTFDYADDPITGLRSVFYGLYMTATQTAALPAGKVFYDIEFERLTDGWVIRPQKGKATTDAEATK